MMKKFFFAPVITIVTACGVVAQSFLPTLKDETVPQKEWWFSVSSLAPVTISASRKWLPGEKTWLKAGIHDLSFSHSLGIPRLNTEYKQMQMEVGGGAFFGLEWRKSLSSRFSFFHGPGISAGASYRVTKETDPTAPVQKVETVTLSGSLFWNAGLLLSIGPHFGIAGEFIPGVGVSNFNGDNYTTFRADAQLGLSNVRLSFIVGRL